MEQNEHREPQSVMSFIVFMQSMFPVNYFEKKLHFCSNGSSYYEKPVVFCIMCFIMNNV